MTPRRVFMLLIAGVLVIAGSLWLVSQRHLEQATLTGDLVLPGLQKSLNDVTEIRVSKGDGTRTTLKKGPTDWLVGERDYPADSGKVRKLLLDLGALSVVEEKTRNPQYYAQLGVEDSNSPKAAGTLLEITTPAKSYALIVGKPARGQSGYVRIAHTAASLLAQPAINVDTDPRHWLDRAVVDISDQQMKEAVIEPAAGPAYTVARTAPQQNDYKVTPLPKGRELDSNGAANGVGSALGSLQADDVRRAAAAAADAAKPDHGIFRTFNGLELDITGRTEGEHHYIALAARSNTKEAQAEAERVNRRFPGWQIEIPAFNYQAIFKPLEDLLKKPEPPKGKTAKPARLKKSASPNEKTD